MDLYKAKKIHLVGIKGVGMTALAQMLKALGKDVYGSDTKEVFFTDAVLRRLKIRIVGFGLDDFEADTDMVISSNAYVIKEKNTFMGRGQGKEIINYALSNKLPVISYPQAVAELFNKSLGISVAGTHGKSSTSAMAGVMLEYCRKDPRAIVGTKVINWQANARVSKRSLSATPFVLESDEYRDAFLNYRPRVTILTSIEWDHPDYYPSFNIYKNSFIKFLSQTKPDGALIYCADDPVVRKIAEKSPVRSKMSYGFGVNNRLRIMSWKSNERGTNFTLQFNGKDIGTFYIKLFGRHNILNATSVVGLGIMLGLPSEEVKHGIAAFKGTARRFEITSYKPGIIVDDYAHHPSEIAATIEGAKAAWPDKDITVLFQPHTFSRTKALFRDFVKALKTAHKVYILATYASAREKIPAKDSARALAKKLNSLYFKDISSARNKLGKTIKDNEVFITMGAGDVWQVGREIKKKKF